MVGRRYEGAIARPRKRQRKVGRTSDPASYIHTVTGCVWGGCVKLQLRSFPCEVWEERLQLVDIFCTIAIYQDFYCPPSFQFSLRWQISQL